MKQTLFIFAASLLFLSGCSMCCGPFDYDYPAFGGKHPRADRAHGRVGSILSDPLTTFATAAADSNLAPPPEQISTELDDLPGTDSGGNEILPERPRTPDNGLERIRGEDTPSEDVGTSENSTASRWRSRSPVNPIR